MNFTLQKILWGILRLSGNGGQEERHVGFFATIRNTYILMENHIHTAQDFIDGDPLLAELFLQWYPDISLAGIAKYYFGRENY